MPNSFFGYFIERAQPLIVFNKFSSFWRRNPESNWGTRLCRYADDFKQYFLQRLAVYRIRCPIDTKEFGVNWGHVASSGIDRSGDELSGKPTKI